jgi:hypothetical protein
VRQSFTVDEKPHWEHFVLVIRKAIYVYRHFTSLYYHHQ